MTASPTVQTAASSSLPARSGSAPAQALRAPRRRRRAAALCPRRPGRRSAGLAAFAPAGRGAWLSALAFALLLPLAAPVRGQDEAPESVPFEPHAIDGRHELPRHAGDYPDFRVIWRTDRTVKDAVAVYPHRSFPRRAAVVTEAGLLISDDAGGTFRPVEGTGPEQIGRIHQLAWAPDDPNRYYLATDRGLHAGDARGRVSHLAGAAEGLIDDRVAGVCFYPGDLAFRTLLAYHGDVARGISRSTDAGETWQPIATDYFVHRLVPSRPGRAELHMVASPADRPGVRNIYHSFAPSNYWNQAATDVLVTSAAQAELSDAVYFTTARQGLLRVSREGGLVERFAPLGLTELASIDVTWGHTADQQLLLIYDPREQGLIVTPGGNGQAVAHARGLFTGPFVREGAQLKALATGRVLLAVANGTLYRGLRVGGSVVVHDARVSPNPFSFVAQTYEDSREQIAARLDHFSRRQYLGQAARDLLTYFEELERSYSPVELTVSADVAVRTGKPRAVSVDLSRLGLSPATAMFDDGAHGDGEPDDGTFATQFTVRPDQLQAAKYDWRAAWPGRVGLTVSALGPGSAIGGEVAPLQLLSRPGTVTFFDNPASFHNQRLRTRYGHGDANFVFASTGGRGAGGPCLLVTVEGTGRWLLPIGRDSPTHNLVGYHAVGLYIKADRATDQELNIHLQDVPSYVAASVTPPVGLKATGRMPAGGIPTDRYLHVVIPLDELLAGAGPFQINRVGWVVLSGPGTGRVRYYVDGIRFYREPGDVEQPRRPDELDEPADAQAGPDEPDGAPDDDTTGEADAS